MEYKINKVTGLAECTTSGKLLSIGETIKEFKNEKKTQYRTGVVALDIVNEETGETITKNAFCNIYEKQVEKMEIGKVYQATITEMSDGGVLVTLSNSVNVETLSSDLFDFSLATVSQVKESEVSVFSK